MAFQKVVAHALGWQLRDSRGFLAIKTADGASLRIPVTTLGAVAAYATLLNGSGEVSWDQETGAILCVSAGPSPIPLEGGDGPFPFVA